MRLNDGVTSEENEKREKKEKEKGERIDDHERGERTVDNGFVTPHVGIVQRLMELRRITERDQPVLTAEEPDDQKRSHHTVDEHLPVVRVR